MEPLDELEDPYPRAPSQTEWDAMPPAERRRAVDALPCTMTEAELSPPEGDPHSGPADATQDVLGEWFGRKGRSLYIGKDLAVYYPDEARFAPDIFVVFDVEPGPRDKWVVSHEGRGLDWVLEVLYSGSRSKDLDFNVKRYARLGVPEYFVYDSRRQRIHGFRLPEAGATKYVPILPQYGRLGSDVLGLDLGVADGRLHFYSANARLAETPELLRDLQDAMTETAARIAELEESLDLERSGREAAEEARVSAEEALALERSGREAAEQRAAELAAKLERLERERR